MSARDEVHVYISNLYQPITDDKMTRFNITLDQSVEMVFWALENSIGGEIYVPKIPSYRIQDLAKAIGPDCSKLINNIFNKTHHTYLMNSKWDVVKNYKFQKYFLNFCKEVIKKNNIDHSLWLNFRYKCITKKNSRLILQNKDFLAIKK